MDAVLIGCGFSVAAGFLIVPVVKLLEVLSVESWAVNCFFFLLILFDFVFFWSRELNEVDDN